MRRRTFIAALGSAAAWPVVARAQQSSMPVIGFLNTQSAETFARYTAAFREGLKEAGYVEGQNVTIEYRWAEGHYGRLPALAAELLGRHPAVIAATGGSPAALAAKAATTTIPVVFEVGVDPVAAGLVTSLNHPDSNFTGVVHTLNFLGPKQLETIREILHTNTPIAVLANPRMPSTRSYLTDIQDAADAIGQRLDILNASSEEDIDNAFTKLRELRSVALIIQSEPFFNSQRHQIVNLAASNAIPAIYPAREFVTAGGLMSYGVSISDVFWHTGVYVGEILKGSKPANLPVMQETKVELVLNRKTARAMGLTFPLSLLGRADEIIE